MPKKKFQAFETSTYNNQDCKPKNNAQFFSDKYIKCKSKCDEKILIKPGIKPNLGNVINDLRASGWWKNHLTMIVNFMLSKDNYDKWLIDSKSDNIELWLVIIKMKY